MKGGVFINGAAYSRGEEYVAEDASFRQPPPARWLNMKITSVGLGLAFGSLFLVVALMQIRLILC
jgi:hypothetical protein